MSGIEGTFDVVGARTALTTFGTMQPARLGHAYAFTGPAGAGKKTFARRLAQSLLCETPKHGLLGYCGRCPGCRTFVARTHPDYVESAGTIKIGKELGSALHDEDLTARDLVRALALHGYSGGRRVVVLGDVAFATHEAANALLRFFEEPPAGVVVVLTTSAPGTLLATIRSRFVEVPFGPLKASDVERILRSEGVAEDRAARAAALALGSVVRAHGILGDDDGGVREASFVWFARAACGEQPDASFLRLDDRSVTGAEKRETVRALVEVVRVAVRDWAALVLAGSAAPLLAPDRRDAIERLPSREPGTFAALLAALAEAERIARSNVPATLIVEYLRVQLAPQASRPATTEASVIGT